MTEQWEKQKNNTLTSVSGGSRRLGFLVSGLLILGAIVFLILSGTITNAQYFMTVDELVTRDDLVNKDVRVSGAVIGDTIEYDAESLTIRFTMVHIPAITNDLAETLHFAVNNPDAERLNVVVYNEPMPDLLQHEAQAIVTGEMGDDGNFYADELLLKCPTRYEEAVPEQADVEEASAS